MPMMGINASKDDELTAMTAHRSRSRSNHTHRFNPRDESIGETEATGTNNCEVTGSSKKDIEYLIGNLEKLPASAKKLFDMGKLYLTTGSSKSKDDEGFCSLFQPLPRQESDQPPEGVNAEETVPAVSSVPGCSSNLFIPMKKSAPLHHAQTYIQWKAARDLNNFYMYTFCMPQKRTIYLQPMGDFPDFVKTFSVKTGHLKLNFFEALQGFAQIFFSGLEVLIRPPMPLNESEEKKITSRIHEITQTNQYCVNDLYPILQDMLPNDGVCITGITWTDIYPEGYNFVLGEASVNHKAAVISFGRFEPKGYCAKSHEDIHKVDGMLMWKLMKSLSHELCHLLGLEHCTFFQCDMNESSSVAESLSQPLFLCPVCLRKLQSACGFDVLERYQLLQNFIQNLTEQLDETSKLQESLEWLNICVKYLNS